MTNEEAKLILEQYTPKPSRGNGKSIQTLKLIEAFLLAIRALDEERPKGKWIITHYDYIECSNCEDTVPSSTCGEYKYCPHCGAEMIGTEKEKR